MNQKTSRSLRWVIVAMFSCLIMQTTWAQNVQSRKLEGVVTNEQKEPVQGAVVEEKQSGTSVLTDASGKFSISVKEKGTLSISFTGYLTQAVAYTASSASISVVLAIDTKGMEEVVVVGYNTVKRKDVTGAVAGINSKDIKSRPVTNAVQAMQGKVAGANIVAEAVLRKMD
jgi:hypothetical protein